MTALTFGVFAPDLFLARGVADRVTAINFVADTLLFAGMMFAIARAVVAHASPSIRDRGSADAATLRHEAL
jgi:hypothetical protein